MVSSSKGDDRSSASASRKRKPSGPSSTSSAMSIPSKKSVTSPSKKTPPTIIDYGPFEEKQAVERPAAKDSAYFKSTCNSMRGTLGKILEVKQNPSSRRSDLTELKTDFLMHLMSLKKLNRLDKLRTKNSREGTVEAKSKVDSCHLQLQNLLYEVTHLQKEVTKCLQYKSADEDMDLVSVDQFYKDAPEDIADKDKIGGNEHLQRLARLEYEKLQREEQSEQLKTYEHEKEALESHISKKQENLSNLKPQLSTILQATEPVQKLLKMPLNEERDQMEKAKYLPRSLFVMFSETRAYGQACDSDIKVSIEGDLEEAKADFDSKLSKRLSTTGDAANHHLDEDDDLEPKEEEEEDGDDSKKKKKKASMTDSNRDHEAIKKLLITHPLKVHIKVGIDAKNTDNAVTMIFSHITELEVVTVQVKLNLDQVSKSQSGEREVLQAQQLLAHLLNPNDDGNTCPNPAFRYILKNQGLDYNSSTPGMFSHLGAMYSWAQQLSGLKFPDLADPELSAESSSSALDSEILQTNSNITTVAVDASICQSFVEKIIKAIRERLVSRIALQRQIFQLDKSKLISVELEIPEKCKSQFPAKISSVVRAWAPVSWEQFAALDVTRHLVETKAVNEHDYLFRLQLNRDTHASLIALIAVNPDYPNTLPIFCLNLHWNGEHNIHNSENLRALEKSVNFGFIELLDQKGPEKYEILSLQIKKLMASFDVLLESWQMQGTDFKMDFPREKIFLHPVRGRRRLPPLNYDSNYQMFSQ